MSEGKTYENQPRSEIIEESMQLINSLAEGFNDAVQNGKYDEKTFAPLADAFNDLSEAERKVAMKKISHIKSVLYDRFEARKINEPHLSKSYDTLRQSTDRKFDELEARVNPSDDYQKAESVARNNEMSYEDRADQIDSMVDRALINDTIKSGEYERLTRMSDELRAQYNVVPKLAEISRAIPKANVDELFELRRTLEEANDFYGENVGKFVPKGNTEEEYQSQVLNCFAHLECAIEDRLQTLGPSLTEALVLYQEKADEFDVIGYAEEVAVKKLKTKRAQELAQRVDAVLAAEEAATRNIEPVIKYQSPKGAFDPLNGDAIEAQFAQDLAKEAEQGTLLDPFASKRVGTEKAYSGIITANAEIRQALVHRGTNLSDVGLERVSSLIGEIYDVEKLSVVENLLKGISDEYASEPVNELSTRIAKLTEAADKELAELESAYSALKTDIRTTPFEKFSTSSGRNRKVDVLKSVNHEYRELRAEITDKRDAKIQTAKDYHQNTLSPLNSVFEAIARQKTAINELSNKDLSYLTMDDYEWLSHNRSVTFGLVNVVDEAEVESELALEKALETGELIDYGARREHLATENLLNWLSDFEDHQKVKLDSSNAIKGFESAKEKYLGILENIKLVTLADKKEKQLMVAEKLFSEFEDKGDLLNNLYSGKDNDGNTLDRVTKLNAARRINALKGSVSPQEEEETEEKQGFFASIGAFFGYHKGFEEQDSYALLPAFQRRVRQGALALAATALVGAGLAHAGYFEQNWGNLAQKTDDQIAFLDRSTISPPNDFGAEETSEEVEVAVAPQAPNGSVNPAPRRRGRNQRPAPTSSAIPVPAFEERDILENPRIWMIQAEMEAYRARNRVDTGVNDLPPRGFRNAPSLQIGRAAVGEVGPRGNLGDQTIGQYQFNPGEDLMRINPTGAVSKPAGEDSHPIPRIEGPTDFRIDGDETGPTASLLPTLNEIEAGWNFDGDSLDDMFS